MHHEKAGQNSANWLAALVVLLTLGVALTIGWRPLIGPKSRPLSSRKFESSPQRLERGRYLFTGIAGCVDCHSQHDNSRHGVPVIAGTEGGGEPMPFDDLPGIIIAPNITPDRETGAGNWSDDQLARAIREGIGHDGRALFTMMPYPFYRKMSDEDLASVIVYLRSLAPLRHELPNSKMMFPVNYLVRSAPSRLRLRWPHRIPPIECNGASILRLWGDATIATPRG